jgi:hypothetical protein
MGRQRPSTWLGISAGLPLLSGFALDGHRRAAARRGARHGLPR